MMLKPEEVTSAIKSEIQKYEKKLKMESVGYVLQVGDGIARVYGLEEVMAGELVQFSDDTMGIALNLETNNVGVVILGSDANIKEGGLVRRTEKIVQVPTGKALLGRIINPLGKPLDNKGPITTKSSRPVECVPPNVLGRQPVKEPLQTGIKAIDSMIPIGRGQRELIIGDRQTGKTAIAIDAIVNQKGQDVYCIYVAIGQKLSSIVQLAKTLEAQGALEYTTIVVASSEDPAPLQYLAPYAGCAMGEEFLYTGKHALVVYDDLSKHAQAYRQLSLLLQRPPGREAYPGDVFYLHSRLLERAAKLHDKLGGGSLTALPIIETQAGDISSYIPTNVISITDGQIYLEGDLFYAGIRPAINVGLSVSRVGGNAQTKAMKQVAGMLRLSLAQHRELAAFAQLSTDLDQSTRDQLTRGDRMVEILKQNVLSPIPLAKQVLIIFAGINGYLDDVKSELVKKFETELLVFIEKNNAAIENEIQTQKVLTEANEKRLREAITAFKKEFVNRMSS
ncbi:MAG: F0F1 ATP synthase subunit alpha [Omnitrophica bacterium RIFCSPHIGHO2_02_FULL_46_11]|nr:MAG: F0F1 ATP synthase subunit alpha [Omnitrophica bacterium RIFCSPLOWO2_01_FULL_45_10b]OGW87846.1 MAG: F0F1 ATP synthase subunit alpha [Omnitrophica bacterium RIFCSPHIGHO2_02_FULL_46_11]